MARRSARPQPDQTLELPTLTRICPACGGSLWAAYKTQRTVTTLGGAVRLRLQVRRCRSPLCPRHAVPLRPGCQRSGEPLRLEQPGPQLRPDRRARGEQAGGTTRAQSP